MTNRKSEGKSVGLSKFATPNIEINSEQINIEIEKNVTKNENQTPPTNPIVENKENMANEEKK